MLSVTHILDNRFSESKVLDYKRTLDLKDRIEFLKDISSFLNSDGGQILVGVDEVKGIPTIPLVGFSFQDLDQAKLQIESIIRTGISPVIQGVQIINHEYGGRAMVEIRIPQGYDKPYQVTYQRHDRFYVRTSSGKHQMERNEIKEMFLNTNLIQDRVRAFVENRLSILPNEQYLFQGKDMAAVVMHLSPHCAFLSDEKINLRDIVNSYPTLKTLAGVGYPHWNNEGLIYYGYHMSDYIQIFRNGIFEIFSTNSTMVGNDVMDDEIRKQIPSTLFENNLLKVYRDHLNLLRTIPMQLPLSINLNIVNAVGMRFAGRYDARLREIVYNKERLPLVSSQVNDYNDEPVMTFKPIFDSLWNTFGFAESENTKT